MERKSHYMYVCLSLSFHVFQKYLKGCLIMDYLRIVRSRACFDSDKKNLLIGQSKSDALNNNEGLWSNSDAIDHNVLFINLSHCGFYGRTYKCL